MSLLLQGGGGVGGGGAWPLTREDLAPIAFEPELSGKTNSGIARPLPADAEPMRAYYLNEETQYSITQYKNMRKLSYK